VISLGAGAAKPASDHGRSRLDPRVRHDSAASRGRRAGYPMSGAARIRRQVRPNGQHADCSLDDSRRLLLPQVTGNARRGRMDAVALPPGGHWRILF